MWGTEVEVEADEGACIGKEGVVVEDAVEEECVVIVDVEEGEDEGEWD